MFSRIVSLIIRPDSHGELLAAVERSGATAVRDELGRLRFDVCADRVDLHRFFLYQVYIDDEAAEAAHFTEHFPAWRCAADRYVEPGTQVGYSTDALDNVN